MAVHDWLNDFLRCYFYCYRPHCDVRVTDEEYVNAPAAVLRGTHSVMEQLDRLVEVPCPTTLPKADNSG